MTTPASSTIVQHFWNYCNAPCVDSISCGDYIGLRTYLLFLKMDDQSVHILGKLRNIPMLYNIASLDNLPAGGVRLP
jgi:hypothetical protein